MYVCGPTVYNNVHLEMCTFMSFDVIFDCCIWNTKYVMYVTTDVGHIVDDAGW
jgi:cysteinyl-tRNA synthetase